MIKLPTFQETSGRWTYNVDLESISVTLNFNYNIRNERFYLDIITADAEIIGIKIVENFPVISPHYALFQASGLSGDFICIKDDGNVDDVINYDNFGNGWNLYYLNAAELAEWETANGI